MRSYYERDDEAIRQSKLEDEMKKKAKSLHLENISHAFENKKYFNKREVKLEEYKPIGLPLVIIHGESCDREDLSELVGVEWLKHELPSSALFFTLGRSKNIGSYKLDFYSAQARALQFYEFIGART